MQHRLSQQLTYATPACRAVRYGTGGNDSRRARHPPRTNQGTRLETTDTPSDTPVVTPGTAESSGPVILHPSCCLTFSAFGRFFFFSFCFFRCEETTKKGRRKTQKTQKKKKKKKKTWSLVTDITITTLATLATLEFLDTRS